MPGSTERDDADFRRETDARPPSGAGVAPTRLGNGVYPLQAPPRGPARPLLHLDGALHVLVKAAYSRSPFRVSSWYPVPQPVRFSITVNPARSPLTSRRERDPCSLPGR